MPATDQTKEQWLLCPLCKSKTRIKLQPCTVLQNFLLFCPKCKMETMIHVKNFKTDIIKEPDAKMQNMPQTQSR